MLKKSSLTDELKSLILKKARTMHKKQIQWRRHFHQYPELSTQEFKTTAFIKKELQALQLKKYKLNMPTGILTELKRKTGPLVAIRSDIDALPVFEKTNLPFQSKNPGCMHACGHDVHIATVMGVAHLLVSLKDYFPGSVRFLFQPAEEMPPGGARPMIENGAIDGVEMIFGLHVDPRLPTGKIGLRDGVSMASVLDFDLIIHGRGGHAARPQDAVDAIVTATEIVGSLQKVIAREIDPIDPAAITFGKINGGVARNVISDKVTLVGTARSLNARTSKMLPKLIKRTAEGICRARGAKLEMNLIADYPVLANDKSTNRVIQRNFETLFGRGKMEETEPVLGGEDFACYLEKTKGAMFRLGCMNKKIKADQPWHSPKFIVDEEAIFYGTATATASIIDYCLSKA